MKVYPANSIDCLNCGADLNSDDLGGIGNPTDVTTWDVFMATCQKCGHVTKCTIDVWCEVEIQQLKD